MNAEVAASFLFYILSVFALGVYSARYARRSSSDFFLAARKLGAWVAALSASASAESGWVTLGLVGMAFHTGVAAFWVLPGTIVAMLFNWLVLGRKLRAFAKVHDAITLPDVLATAHAGKYAAPIRIVSVAIILFMLSTYTAAQFTAAAKTFEATFDWTYLAGVLAGGGLVLIYTVLGGFRAVAWTDVAQALLMLSGVTIVPLALMHQIGGWEALLQRLSAQNPALIDPWAAKDGLELFGFFALWFGIPFGYPGQPHILVRFMASRDEAVIRRGAIISNIWVFVLFSGAVMLGISARAYYGWLPDAEKALPVAATELLPGWLAGMMLAAVMSAIGSTADSQLLVCGSCINHDLLDRTFGLRFSRRFMLRVHRLAVLFIGVTAMGIAAVQSRIIFHFVLYAWAGLGAAFGPALILTLLGRKTTGAGIVAGMLAGLATAIAWAETPALKSLCYELLPAFMLSLLVIVIVSRATRVR